MASWGWKKKKDDAGEEGSGADETDDAAKTDEGIKSGKVQAGGEK